MNDGTRQNLTLKQEHVLVRLLAGASIESAARSARVSRQTVSVWVNHHALFAAELRARQAEAIDRAVRRLALGLEQAARSMTGLTESRDEGIRLRASIAVFETLAHVKDTADFESRLSSVEALLAVKDSKGIA